MKTEKNIRCIFRRSVQKVSSHSLWKSGVFFGRGEIKTQDTRNSVHRIMMLNPLQSRTLRTSVNPASLPLFKTLQNPLLELPLTAPSYFPESHQRSEISSLSKVILVLRKARSHRVPIAGCRRAELMCHQKNSAQAGTLSQRSCQPPAAQSCGRFHCIASLNKEHWDSTPYPLLWKSNLWWPTPSTKRSGLCFQIKDLDPPFISGHDLLEEIWYTGSGLSRVVCNCSTMFLLLW